MAPMEICKESDEKYMESTQRSLRYEHILVVVRTDQWQKQT